MLEFGLSARVLGTGLHVLCDCSVEKLQMMTYQRIGSYVTAEPFRPFRIKMVSGQIFEIRHPEMVQVGRTTMTIFTYMSTDDEQAKQREYEVSLLLIESVEPLEFEVGC